MSGTVGETLGAPPDVRDGVAFNVCRTRDRTATRRWPYPEGHSVNDDPRSTQARATARRWIRYSLIKAVPLWDQSDKFSGFDQRSWDGDLR